MIVRVLIVLVLAGGELVRGAGAAAPRKPSPPDSRPNVVFLLTDDQRADTIAALGNKAISTPALDALVRRGYTFRNAYCLGGNSPAVCLPSRNMILSGRAYFRFGAMAPAAEANLPVSMKRAGYATFHYGKRGNTALEIQKEFDVNRMTEDDRERRSGEPGKEIVDAALAYLREAPADRPFFLYLAFGNPHDPRVAAPRYLAAYDPVRIPLPANFLPVHPFDNGEMTVRDERLAPWPRTEEEIRRHLRDYYAVITALDGQIGRLLQALDENGQLDNTLIVFSSDHGLAIGSHGLMGKQNLYEHSMKAPLILAGPGVPHGRSDALVWLLDIYPTICDLAGVPIPWGLDGTSLAPVLRGEKEQVRESLFLAYRDVQRAVRDVRWKLIRYPQIHKTQLFDLESDPDERIDLSDDPRHRETVDRLMRELARWQEHFGDTQPLSAAVRKDAKWAPPEAGN